MDQSNGFWVSCHRRTSRLPPSDAGEPRWSASSQGDCGMLVLAVSMTTWLVALVWITYLLIVASCVLGNAGVLCSKIAPSR